LPQLPGMQVIHALVGCQKRWINSLARRVHSLDMMKAVLHTLDLPGASRTGKANHYTSMARPRLGQHGRPDL
jgi:hypothetical protein